MLLAVAWWRLPIAGVVAAAIWIAVPWVAPLTPSLGPARRPAIVPGPPSTVVGLGSGPLCEGVRSGLAAPGSGRFDRFDVTGQPIAAPVNARSGEAGARRRIVMAAPR